MKFLLTLVMVIGSTLAQANISEEGYAIKCYERDGQGMDLAYIIKKWDHKLKLLDCTGDMKGDCQERGYLKKIERQDENCLVLKHRREEGPEAASMLGGSWSMCHEEQETFDMPRLVPVTVTDDEQEARIYCERGILHIL